MKTLRSAVLMLAVPLLALAGCLKDAVDVSQLGLGKDGGIFSPGGILSGETEYVYAEAAEIPPEVPALMTAVMLRLRGETGGEVTRLLSVSGSEVIRPEVRFRYRGFAVRRVLIDDFETDDGRPGQRRLAGRLYLEDPMGRATSITFDLSYALLQQKLHISAASWSPTLSQEPRSALYVVPRQAIEPELDGIEMRYRELYALVLDRALPVATGAPLPQSAQDYLLFVFIQDRLGPRAELDLRIGEEPEQGGGYSGASSLIVFPEGWAVGLIAGRFDLSREEPLWVKVFYKPRAYERLDLIGLFSMPPQVEPAS
ncbi:MAG: hypothetical protein QNJ30_03160 [Kiloniellales bacterium]|nr:hypothetical protein [Kiloniellales bacterium]